MRNAQRKGNYHDTSILCRINESSKQEQRRDRMKNNLKLLFVSLGCDKNLVDTEFMLGMLRDDGIEMTDDEQEADIIIVNTCCFINDAKEESINTILEMAELKKEGKGKNTCYFRLN